VPSIVIGSFAYDIAALSFRQFSARFTLFNNRFLSTDLRQPISSLIVQVTLVLLCSLLTRVATSRVQKLRG